MGRASHGRFRTGYRHGETATDNTDNTATASRGQHGQHGSGSHGRSFEHLTYGDALRKVRCLGQALLDRGLSAERPLAILSGNSVEHLLLALAAQHVGVPYAPVSPAYSLVSTDFGALKHVLALLTPGLVFVSDAALFARALDAAVGPDVEVAHAGRGPALASRSGRW